MLIAAALCASPAAAQASWPEEPIIVGMGFERCADILAVADNDVRSAMVGQWAFGFLSGMATAGAESEDPSLAGLDDGIKRFLRQHGGNSAQAMNDIIIEQCRADPDAHMAQLAFETAGVISASGRE